MCSLYVVVVASVYLLAVPLSGYTVIAEYKYKLFLALNITFIIVLCLFWCEYKLIGKLSEYPQTDRVKPELICMALFFLFSVISGLLSEYTGVFWGNGRKDGILTIGTYVLVFLFLFRFLRPSKWILRVFAVSTSLFCALGLVQLFGLNPFGLYPEGLDFYDGGIYYAGEYWSTMGNTDICASFLALSLGVFAAVMVRKPKPLYLIPLGLCVFCIWMLDVSSGVVAMLLGLILLLPVVVDTNGSLCNALCTYGFILLITALAFAMSFSRDGAAFSFGLESALTTAIAIILIVAAIIVHKTCILETASPKSVRKGLLFFILIILIVSVLGLYLYEDFQSGFLQEAHEMLHGNLRDDFGSHRIYIWKQVFAKVKEHWLFGGGPDTLSFREIEGFSRYSDELGILIESGIDVAHNEYLNILVNQGALSFLAYLGMLVLSLKDWWFTATKETEKAIAGAGVLFYCIQAFFGISMYINSLYLWISLAMLNIKTIQTKRSLDYA